MAARCNIDLQEKNGGTPLCIAARNGHVSVVKQLIEAHCNVDLQEKTSTCRNRDADTEWKSADRGGGEERPSVSRIRCRLIAASLQVRGSFFSRAHLASVFWQLLFRAAAQASKRKTICTFSRCT